MNRRQLKKKLLEILGLDNPEEIFKAIADHQEYQLLNPLLIALCHSEERVRWHAVCCFGRIVPAMADRDLESARIVMRRLLWSLNDESGGIGWGAPETMAEIMCHHRQLRQEYVHMLISYMREDGDEPFQDGNYLELPLLQRGLLWGMGRLCQFHRREMIGYGITADVSAYLGSPDIYVVGLAIRCLGMLGDGTVAAKIDLFRQDTSQLLLFIDNILQNVTVGQLAEDALRQVAEGTTEDQQICRPVP